jgi:cytochrome b pre-mRNA-processing protein 3
VLKASRKPERTAGMARRLCAELITQARAPEFFRVLGVPDTMDGRFDLVALHAWLVLDRLNTNPPLAQALVNEIFVNFDEALRHLGTGDIGMNRRLKIMASAFYGRLQAYRSALSEDELCAAIHRNLYRGSEERREQAKAVAAYAWSARSSLASIDLTAGRLEFSPLPNM